MVCTIRPLDLEKYKKWQRKIKQMMMIAGTATWFINGEIGRGIHILSCVGLPATLTHFIVNTAVPCLLAYLLLDIILPYVSNYILDMVSFGANAKSLYCLDAGCTEDEL